MLFDDIFYPDNPKRREEVRKLQAEMKVSFNMYKNNWNSVVTTMNDIFENAVNEEFYGISFQELDYDIEKDDIGLCIEKINLAVNDAKTKLEKFVQDVGLEEDLPTEWTLGKLEYEKHQFTKIMNTLESVGIMVANIFITQYVYNMTGFFLALVSETASLLSKIAIIGAGAITGIVLGAAVFVITDSIVSAITGAIERKRLNEAIDALRELKENVGKPLEDAAGNLKGIKMSMDDRAYKLDDYHFIMMTDDDNYIVIDIRKAKQEKQPKVIQMALIREEKLARA